MVNSQINPIYIFKKLVDIGVIFTLLTNPPHFKINIRPTLYVPSFVKNLKQLCEYFVINVMHTEAGKIHSALKLFSQNSNSRYIFISF